MNIPAAGAAAAAVRRRPWSLEAKLTLGLALLTLLSVGAILGLTFWVHRSFSPPQRVEVLGSSLYPIGGFTVNLLDGFVLKTSISLEFSPQGNGRVRAGARDFRVGQIDSLRRRLSDAEARYRDAIIRILSGKKSNAVLTPASKEELKKEILEELNERGLPGGRFVGLYFSEFMLQKTAGGK